MKKLIIILAATLLIGWLQTVPATAVDETQISPDAVARERTALQTAIAESQKDHPDRAGLTASLTEIVADPAFVVLPEDMRHAAYLLYGRVLDYNRDFRRAYDAIKTASGMPEANDFDWDLRLRNDFELQENSDAVLAATTLARKWPEKLQAYTDSAIFHLARAAERLSPSVESDFLETLHQLPWRPHSEFRSADSVWLSLIRVRLARGDVAGAKAVAMELRDPASILALQIDDRFDDIVRGDLERFDVMKAYESTLADLKTKSAYAPDRLEGIDAVAEVLIVMRRPDEALTLATAALERLKTEPTAYDDAHDQRNWTENIRAGALFDLGRSDEGFAALEEGAAKPENGDVNVSQAINLAEKYNYFDRPADALHAISAIDLSNASDYGRMALQDARACAYYALGDASNRDIALDYLRAHKRDGTNLYLSAMLFTGNIDAAAAEVLAALADPVRRTAVLALLQDYAPDPYPTKRTAAMHDEWVAIRNRPDVAAEIVRMGHINKYALRSPTF